LLGAFLGELASGAAHHQAMRSAWGALVGILVGMVFKLMVVGSMLVYLIVAVVKSF
jgi:uncharacterized protein YqgC (DUF456 family)